MYFLAVQQQLGQCMAPMKYKTHTELSVTHTTGYNLSLVLDFVFKFSVRKHYNIINWCKIICCAIMRDIVVMLVT